MLSCTDFYKISVHERKRTTMPRLFLSPSTQEFNPYIIGGTEEQYMNEIANAMEPYLVSNGIQFTRNDPNESLSQAIRLSNSQVYDLHLALHSNAAPPALSGTLQGTDVYYNAQSSRSRDAAEIIAANFKQIYPDPSRVKAVPNSTLAELVRTNAPAVLIEIAYHDNTEDATWIVNNIQAIARNLVQSLTQYFGIPFVEAQLPQTETVTTAGGVLNIRARPNTTSAVLGTAPNGAAITVLGEWQDWYVVNYNGLVGYAFSDFIQ